MQTVGPREATQIEDQKEPVIQMAIFTNAMFRDIPFTWRVSFQKFRVLDLTKPSKIMT